MENEKNTITLTWFLSKYIVKMNYELLVIIMVLSYYCVCRGILFFLLYGIWYVQERNLIEKSGKPKTKACENMPNGSIIRGKEVEEYDGNLNYICFEKLCGSIITLDIYFSQMTHCACNKNVYIQEMQSTSKTMIHMWKLCLACVMRSLQDNGLLSSCPNKSPMSFSLLAKIIIWCVALS